MPRATLIEELSAGVLLITMNRPERKNAFNNELWCDFRDALAEARQNDAVHATVVTGAGDAFSAGQDLSAMIGGDSSQSGSEYGFSSFMDQLCAFDKPLIAAVNGVGVGIGLTLLLHCDYVYIARGARLRAPFVTLGVVPEAASSYLLPALIGYRKAIDLLFESDFISAERAVELGWTKRLVLATRQDQVAVARRREDDAFLCRIGSPENLEAVSAFFSKRAPDFTNVPPSDQER